MRRGLSDSLISPCSVACGELVSLLFHFTPSFILCSHILSCAGRRHSFNSDILQQAGAGPLFSDVRLRNYLSLLPMRTLLLIPPPSVLDWFCLHDTSKVKATGRAPGKEALMRHCLLLLSSASEPVMEMRVSEGALTVLGRFTLEFGIKEILPFLRNHRIKAPLQDFCRAAGITFVQGKCFIILFIFYGNSFYVTLLFEFISFSKWKNKVHLAQDDERNIDNS